MTDDALLEAIAGLVRLGESHDALHGEMIEAMKLLRQRCDALEEMLGELILEAGRATRNAAPICNMKAATIVVSCEKCGREFANEAGPKLCGPCWVAAGRPSGDLHAV